MTTPHHTPGPWNISKHATLDSFPQYGIHAGAGSYDHVIVKLDNAEADAKLIAAAPDLLAACLDLIDSLDAIDQDTGTDMQTAGRIHDAKIATLDAQGLVEEGYNDVPSTPPTL